MGGAAQAVDQLVGNGAQNQVDLRFAHVVFGLGLGEGMGDEKLRRLVGDFIGDAIAQLADDVFHHDGLLGEAVGVAFY